MRKNKDQKYIPDDLLKLWDFEVKGDLSVLLAPEPIRETVTEEISLASDGDPTVGGTGI